MEKNCWDKLYETYEGDSAVKEIHLEMLIARYENLRMTEDQSFDKFYLELTEIINQSEALGVTRDDKTIVSKILRCLPSKFNGIKSSIREGANFDTMTPEKLAGKLKVHEIEENDHIPNKEKVLEKGVAFLGKRSHRAPEDSSGGESTQDETDEAIDREIELMTRHFKNILKVKSK